MLFPKRDRSLRRDISNRKTPRTCWQELECERALCPAYGKLDVLCWRIRNVHCDEHQEGSWNQKWERCLRCWVFESFGEADPRGWSHFVCDELRALMTSGLAEFGFSSDGSLLQILESLPDGLFIMDREGIIKYLNPASEEITGLTAQQAIGTHCRDVFRATTCETSRVFPKTKGRNVYSREFGVTRLDGKTVSIISSFSVLRDRQGNAIGGVQVFKDISDRKRLEDDVRLSETKYRRIFEGSKDMIFFTSTDGTLKDVNQASVELLEYESKQDLFSLGSVEKVYDNPMHWRVFKKQIDRHGFVKDFEAGLRRKDGTRMHCLLSGTAVKGNDGEITGYEGIVKDVTARMDAIRNLHRRHRELSLLNAVAVAMNATQDLEGILMTALRKVLEVLNLSAGGIFLIDHEKSAFILAVHEGLFSEKTQQTTEVVLHDEVLMRSLLKKELSLTPKPNFPPFRAILKTPSSDETIQLTCFLITAKQRASGFLALDIPFNRELTEQDYHLLGSLGNFLGGAIDNTRLLQTIHKHREELKGLTAKLFQSQELERRRIARELHDEVGGALTGINFTLDTIEKSLSPDLFRMRSFIAEIRKQINHTYEDMRRISHRLHPALLSDLGLEPALDSYLAHICRHTDLQIDFRMVGFGGRLDPEIETILYRLSQEALTNTLRHADAKHFKLSLIKGYPYIIFLAEDDGVGFDFGEFQQNHDHALGLLSMRERAGMLGGKFSLHSSPGKGTRIRIEIPVTEESDVP